MSRAKIYFWHSQGSVPLPLLLACPCARRRVHEQECVGIRCTCVCVHVCTYEGRDPPSHLSLISWLIRRLARNFDATFCSPKN